MESSNDQHRDEIDQPETHEEAHQMLNLVGSLLDNLAIVSPSMAGTIDDGFHYSGNG